MSKGAMNQNQDFPRSFLNSYQFIKGHRMEFMPVILLIILLRTAQQTGIRVEIAFPNHVYLAFCGMALTIN